PDAGANGAGKPKITPAHATNLALAWLAAHAMLPKGVSARDASTQYLHGKVIVQFAPSTRFPLNADQAAVDLTVELDAGGHIFYAHRLWPTLQGAGTARLRSPHSIVTSDTGAAAPGSVQGATSTPQRSYSMSAARVVQIDAISLVYVPAPAGHTVRLQPFYRLQGRTLDGSKKGGPVTKLVPATAAGATATATP
ncbi:MAG: hypothetical protein JWO42_656, partial [Chloroflexi bacterium]|nr:hypothetical protein [Chloroflexota bacterium]